MKRILTMMLILVLALGMLPVAAATEATEASRPVRGEYECGDDLVWSYEDGVLTITGTGEMDDYEAEAPWANYKEEIREVVLEGVTYIGARAFLDYDALETVDFGDKLKEIGQEAFRSCEGLAEITLPRSFKIFGESAFLGCSNLEKIHCDGNFPSFRLNSMWECYATIYYPVERPWAVSLIQELEEAFHGRIEFLASDGTDPYVPTEATVPETELCSYPATEAPTEELTTAPMEAPTTAPTEVPAEATETVETRAPETIPTASAPLPTEEAEGGLRVVLLGLGIGLAAALIAGLLLVIRQLNRKGKYS